MGNGGNISLHWAAGQPDNSYEGQNCLAVMHNATFDDARCSSEKVYVCEKQQPL
jgi:hypothetical protein